jgi:hypothetical protein
MWALKTGPPLLVIRRQPPPYDVMRRSDAGNGGFGVAYKAGPWTTANTRRGDEVTLHEADLSPTSELLFDERAGDLPVRTV